MDELIVYRNVNLSAFNVEYKSSLLMIRTKGMTLAIMTNSNHFNCFSLCSYSISSKEKQVNDERAKTNSEFVQIKARQINQNKA